MDSIISFLVNHWILGAIFIGLALALLANEWRGMRYGMKQVGPQELVNLLNHNNAVIVDVRHPEQFEKGHILGAHNMPQKELESRIALLNKFKTRPLILVCSAGVDAPKLQSILSKGGFAQFYYLAGGMRAWQASSMPVVTK